MSENKRELPLVKRRIEAPLRKTEANGCTAGEALSAFEKAEELVGKYGIDPGSFRWPQKPFTASDAATSAPKSSKPPGVTVTSRGLGVGRLAEQMLVERPGWSHAEIAAEVNRRFDGARATAKSVRWYASRMRKRGEDVPLRRRAGGRRPSAVS